MTFESPSKGLGLQLNGTTHGYAQGSAHNPLTCKKSSSLILCSTGIIGLCQHTWYNSILFIIFNNGRKRPKMISSNQFQVPWIMFFTSVFFLLFLKSNTSQSLICTIHFYMVIFNSSSPFNYHGLCQYRCHIAWWSKIGAPLSDSFYQLDSFISYFKWLFPQQKIINCLGQKILINLWGLLENINLI